MSLGLRLHYMRRWLASRPVAYCEWRAKHASRRMKHAFLVRLACDATDPALIGGHAYAGPDGVDYERMWWAIDGKLPPRRAEEIRAPV